MANNNRELSQLASLVTINDTTRSVSFGSSIESLQVSGIATFSSNATFGSGANKVLIDGETGIISTRRGPLYVDQSKIIEVGVGLASSLARGNALRTALEEVGSQFIGAGVTVTLRLAPGDYYLGNDPLYIYNNGNGRLQIHGSTTGVKPGKTGNHFYNQAGVPDGQNPGLGNTGYSFFYDSTSPAGAYPNPMVGGRGLTDQANTYNKSILDAYYQVRLYHEGLSQGAFSAVVGVAGTDAETNPEYIPGAIVIGRGASNVGINSIFLYSPAQHRHERGVSGYEENANNGFVAAYNSDGAFYDVAVQGFNASILATSNSSVGVHSCASICCWHGLYAITNSILNIFGDSENWDVPTYALNSANYGITVFRNSMIRMATQVVSNNNQSWGINIQHCYGGPYVVGPSYKAESPSMFCNNGSRGIIAANGSSLSFSRKVFVMYNTIGIQADRHSAISADGHVVAYNTNQGIYAHQNSHIIATNAGITTNGQQGALAFRNSGINISSSVIYDNNGSTAGVGNSSTKLQAVAANMSTINVNNINDIYLGAAALLPNKDTLGNSYSYISDSEGTLNT